MLFQPVGAAQVVAATSVKKAEHQSLLSGPARCSEATTGLSFLVSRHIGSAVFAKSIFGGLLFESTTASESGPHDHALRGEND